MEVNPTTAEHVSSLTKSKHFTYEVENNGRLQHTNNYVPGGKYYVSTNPRAVFSPSTVYPSLHSQSGGSFFGDLGHAFSHIGKAVEHTAERAGRGIKRAAEGIGRKAKKIAISAEKGVEHAVTHPIDALEQTGKFVSGGSRELVTSLGKDAETVGNVFVHPSLKNLENAGRAATIGLGSDIVKFTDKNPLINAGLTAASFAVPEINVARNVGEGVVIANDLATGDITDAKKRALNVATGIVLQKGLSKVF
jgi:hypothetical protein